MSDIPEEIRKMFPDQSIHKLDIDDEGNLQILASSEPLLKQPDCIEEASIETVNRYLRDHGYDPEQVGLRGEILAKALCENIELKDRAQAMENKVENLKIALKLILSNYREREKSQAENGWIRFTINTAPKVGKRVLVRTPSGFITIATYFFDGKVGSVRDDSGEIVEYVDEWRLLELL